MRGEATRRVLAHGRFAPSFNPSTFRVQPVRVR
jgi:hypothetical protein